MFLVQDACASCRTEVQTNAPDAANKKPQLKAKGFGAFGGVGRTRRDYSRRCRSPCWGRRRCAVALSRASRSARTRSSNQISK